MRRGRHSANPSPSRPGRAASPKSQVKSGYGWFALVATLVLVAVAITRSDGNHAAVAALSKRSCSAAPRPAADSSATTLLGVNATSPGQLTTATSEFGHLPILRVYYTGMPDPDAWTTGVQAINKSAVVLSFRVPPATILSGRDDAALSHFFDTAPTGHPIYYSYYHEPEPFVTGGQFTLSEYKAAWTHIVAIADAAHNPYLKSTLILMAWDLDSRSGINFKDFLPPGNVISTLGWDAYPAGTVHDQKPQPTSPTDFMGPEVAASKSVGLPFGFAEFALGTQAGRPGWLAEVANYLQSSGALFGTLFNSTGFPWMELNDTASIQAWRNAVDHSALGAPVPAPQASPSRSAPASPTPTAAPTGKPMPTPTAAQTSLVITEPAVSPVTFAPTGANHVRILFKLSHAANISICVLDSQGAVVRKMDRADQPAGWSSIWYFGHDERGNLLPAGRYPVLIVASDAEGSTTAETTLTIAAR
jgi:hypothetical protein